MNAEVNPLFVPPVLDSVGLLGVLHADGDTVGCVTSNSLTTTSQSGYLYQMAGVASTPAVNLKNQKILMSAFEQYLPVYKTKPIYCFEHDASLSGVIGHVDPTKITLTDDALSYGAIYLQDVPQVRAIAALIENGSVRSQSIGAWVLKEETDSKLPNIRILTLLWLYETSLTALGANWDAVVDVVKNRLQWSSQELEDKLQGIQDGAEAVRVIYNSARDMTVPSAPVSIVNQFGEPVESQEKTGYNGPVPGIVATEHVEGMAVMNSVDSATLTAIPSSARNRDDLMESGHAARRVTSAGKSNYLFPIARWSVDNQALAYDWPSVQNSICFALGASAPDMRVLDRDEQQAILNRIGEAYVALGKRIPTLDGVAITNHSGTDFIDFSSVEFHEGENEAFTVSRVENNLKSAVETLKATPSLMEIEAIRNYCHAAFEIYVSIYNEDDAEMAGELMAKVAEVRRRQHERYMAEEAGTIEDSVKTEADEVIVDPAPEIKPQTDTDTIVLDNVDGVDWNSL